MNEECTTDYYPHAKHQRTVDGGYSGSLVVTLADAGFSGSPSLVFVDSDVLASKLVLTPGEAWELGYALIDAARLAGHFGETAQPPVVMLSHAETAEREDGAERLGSEGQEVSHAGHLSATEAHTKGRRPALPTDPPCSCGRPAVVIYLTEDGERVPSCR